MAPFRYQSFDNTPYVQSAADLLQAGPRAQAQAALASGQAWAGAAQNIGQSIAAIPGQIQQQKDQGLQRQVLQGKVDDANALRSGQQKMDSLMAGDQLPADAVGPRKESYLRPDGLYDIPKLNQGLASMGVGHLAPDLLKHAEDLNASITTAQQHDQQAAQSKAIMLGFMANGALKLHETVGMPLDGAIDFIAQPGLATQQIKPQELAAFKQQIARLPPEQQVAALQQIKAHAAEIAPTKEHSKDSTTTNIFGDTVSSNIVAEPNKGDFTGPDGIRRHANGTPVTGEVMQPQRAPASIEEQLLEAVAKGDKTSADRIVTTMRMSAQAKKDPAAAALASELGALRAEEARARLQKIYEGKEPNQGQFTAAGYAGRIEQSGGILDKLSPNIAGMNYAKFKVEEKLPSTFQSGDFQSYDQAARNLVNAILRRESGAAISESEFENARKQYLPLPGDTAQTLSQKKQNRDYVFKTMKDASGKAYEPAVGPPQAGAPAVGAMVGPGEGTVQPIAGFPGMEQTFKNGKWIRTK